MRAYTSMDDAYKEICKDLLTHGKEVRGTRELNNYGFHLTNMENNIVNCRDISISYLLAEMTWYMEGRNDVAFINDFAKLWGRISDDGVTNNSAYGDILFKRHGFNQVIKAIELLQKDPTSRRAVLNFNVPNENVIETKDEICTIALQLLIRDDKLHCTCIMRSNDVWFGLPYDIAFFTELAKFIARQLNIGYGTYTHFVTSLHVYDRDIDKISNLRDSLYKIKINFDKLGTVSNKVADMLRFVDDKKLAIVIIYDALGVISYEPK